MADSTRGATPKSTSSAPPPPGHGDTQGWESVTLTLDPVDLLDELVYEYLVHECYGETAELFGRASGLSKLLSSSSTSSSSDPPAAAAAASASATPSSSKLNKNKKIKRGTGEDFEGGDEGGTTVVGEGGRGFEEADEDDMMMDHDHPPPAPAPPTTTATANKLSLSSSNILLRKSVLSLISKGRIRDAVTFIHTSFPLALTDLDVLLSNNNNNNNNNSSNYNNNHENSTVSSNIKHSNTASSAMINLYFQLMVQEFIECVRRDYVNHSLSAFEFARDELGKFVYFDPRYRNAMAQVLALIAYPGDPADSLLGKELMSQDKREDLAMAVNSYLLAFEKLPPQTAIESVVRQITVCLDQYIMETHKDKKSSKSNSSSAATTTATAPQVNLIPTRWNFSNFINEAGL